MDLYKDNMANTAQIKPIDYTLIANDTCPDVPTIEYICDEMVLYNTIVGEIASYKLTKSHCALNVERRWREHRKFPIDYQNHTNLPIVQIKVRY